MFFTAFHSDDRIDACNHDDDSGLCPAWEGFHSSWVVTVAVPRTSLEALLRDGDRLFLSEHHELPEMARPESPDLYPVMLLGGCQEEVRLTLDDDGWLAPGGWLGKLAGVFLESPFGGPLNYLEAISLIPYAKFRCPVGMVLQCNYPHQLLLDSSMATVLGEFVQLPKEICDTSAMDALNYEVHRIEDGTINSIEMKAQFPAGDDVCDTVKETLQEIFENPVLGSAKRLQEAAETDAHFGAHRFTMIDSRWNINGGRLSKVALQCQVGDRFCEALADRNWFDVPPVEDSIYGAYWMERIPWRIPLPKLYR